MQKLLAKGIAKVAGGALFSSLFLFFVARNWSMQQVQEDFKKVHENFIENIMSPIASEIRRNPGSENGAFALIAGLGFAVAAYGIDDIIRWKNQKQEVYEK